MILNWIFYWIELAQNNFELNIFFNWILAFFSDWIIFLNWILIIFFWIENWIESFSTVFFWIKNWIESFSTVLFWIKNWIESFSTVFFWIKNWIESFSSEIQSLIESSNCTSQGYPEMQHFVSQDGTGREEPILEIILRGHISSLVNSKVPCWPTTDTHPWVLHCYIGIQVL